MVYVGRWKAEDRKVVYKLEKQDFSFLFHGFIGKAGERTIRSEYYFVYQCRPIILEANISVGTG